jgi:Mrp family chromosome partitioning ATPase
VLSGKGGVGKSTVSCQLAWSLAACGLQVMFVNSRMAAHNAANRFPLTLRFSLQNYQVGLLDIDICGPSVPHLMGVGSSSIQQSPLGWIPVYPVTYSRIYCRDVP